MTGQELYEAWRAKGALVLCRHDYKKTGLTYSAVFPPNMVSEIGRLHYEAGYFLEDLSAMQGKDGLLVTYHYDSTETPGRVAVRALAGEGRTLLSLTSVYQGAEWHEREAGDFFGLKFIGNPNPVPLLVPHDFPGPPPLLKEEGALAAMRDLKLFGDEPEVLDAAWEPVVEQAVSKGEGA